MGTIGDEWRDKPLDEVAEASIASTMQTHRIAGAELQRRTIETLARAADESAKASHRLLVATWVLVALTVVLVVLTVAIIVSE